jgi:hypothetical protein
MVTQHRMKRNTAWWLGFFGALTFYWGAATLGGFDWTMHWKLARTSAEAQASVARTEPQNHCLAYYEFEVAGRRYYGSGSACSASVGDKLHAYYLPGDPTFNTLKQPGSDLAFMITAPLILSCIAGFIVMIRVGRPGD